MASATRGIHAAGNHTYTESTQELARANNRIKPPVMSLLYFPFVGQTKCFDESMRWLFRFLAPLSTGATGGMKQPRMYCLDPKDCNVVGVVLFCFRNCCFTWKNISSKFATLHLVLADRRATARTTTRWAMQHPGKKNIAWTQNLWVQRVALLSTRPFAGAVDTSQELCNNLG